MTETPIALEKGKGLIDSMLPNADSVWAKFQSFQNKNPDATPEKLIQNFINQYAVQTGAVGAVTSVGGLFTLLFLLPVDIAVSTRMEAELIYLIAFARGIEPNDKDLQMMVYWVLAGETAKSAGRLTAEIALENLATHKATDIVVTGAKEIGKEVAMETGKATYKKASQVFGGMGRKAGQKAVQKAGKKAARKASTKVLAKAVPKLVAKIFPLVGIVIGFLVNFFSTRSVGQLADEWFENVSDYHTKIVEIAVTIDDETPEVETEAINS